MTLIQRSPLALTGLKGNAEGGYWPYEERTGSR
jgi:hypothetical protein